MSALLDVRGVTKTFGGLTAVKDATLTAGEGQITALIGPNGAGKTTLFNVITGFEAADSGTIVFAGGEIQRRRPWQVARLGMVRTFQTPVGFPKLSIWDNLMVSAADARSESLLAALRGPRAWRPSFVDVGERSEQVLTDLGLWERRHQLIEDLSIGETKLVEFARQLVNGPRMLLLDEPASGVDPVQIGKLRDLVLGLKEKGMAVLVIDHNLSFILSIADHVYVLAAGEMLASGPPDAVARDPRVIETYLGKSPAEATA
jgi:ABC-type branched-subunit amino acid transport system ATPase component